MIGIDLVPDKDIWVHYTSSQSPITRIGDVILLEKSITDQDNVRYESRPPWKELCVANEWSYKSGIYSGDRSGFGTNEYITFVTALWNLEKFTEVDAIDENLSLALVQMNSGGLQAAYCTDCKLAGIAHHSKEDVRLAFSVEDCQMVYNR